MAHIIRIYKESDLSIRLNHVFNAKWTFYAQYIRL